jgi:V8-like Glu-specific endopeptidase
MAKAQPWSALILLGFFCGLTGCSARRIDESPTKNVFGQDDRSPVVTHDHPYDAIGRLSVGCTATLISRQMILTASHCVFNARGERSSRILRFTPNQIHGAAPSSYDTILIDAGTTVPYSDVSTYDKDWALLALDRPVSRVHRPLRLARATPAAGDYVSIVGYSQDYENGNTATAHFDCQVQGQNNQSFLHDCDVMRGASGASLLQRNFDTGIYEIVGIESGERRSNPASDGYFDDYSHDNANVAVSSSVFYDQVKSNLATNPLSDPSFRR